MFVVVMKKINSFIILNLNTILVVYVLLAVIAAVQLLLLPSDTFTKLLPEVPGDIMIQNKLMVQFLGHKITNYNNYLIFKNSFFHLAAGKNLYAIYPSEHWDFFKYTPTFAFFMGGLSYLPDYIGLPVWNILNALAVYYGVRMLPFADKAKCYILWFVAIELLTSLQNTQSNGMICGCILLAYGCMERGKLLWATLFLVAVTFIKVYGAIGFCLFLFYPQKPKFILYSLFWTIVLLAAPLLVTSFDKLIWQYNNWRDQLLADHAGSLGISVMGWMHTWFGFSGNKSLVTLGGAVLFLLQFARIDLYKDKVYRLMILASMLIWVIIFNHKAESPTYIIAAAGVAIWYFARPAATWRTVLLWVVFVFTCMSATDLFPPVVKTAFFVPYTIKAVPCIAVWCVILVELAMMTRNNKNAKPVRGLASAE